MNRPNIVFILSDDQGWWALGAAGNREIRTPCLDRLAAEGIHFRNFFCASPVCSPARASILTGEMPSRHGVLDWIQGGNIGPGAVDYLEGRTLWPTLLAHSGYTCAQIGKWHLGDSATPRPGFFEWITTPLGGGAYRDPQIVRGGRVAQEKGYLTDILADEAIRFLEHVSGDPRPFCLLLNFTAPHSPWLDQHPEDIVASYDDCPFESAPQEPPHEWLDRVHDFDFSRKLASPARARQENIPAREYLKGYYAATTAMDRAIARVLARLDQTSDANRTLVVFMSDNGFSCGHHGIWGKGNATWPLNLYENSIKIPCIMRWPERIVAGRVCDELLSQYDILPTILDICGLTHPKASALPGASFFDLLGGEEARSSWRDRVHVFDEYGAARMVRTKEWKYIHRHPDGPHELYDLRNDPGERHNLLNSSLSSEMREISLRFHRDLDEWFTRYTDKIFDRYRSAVMGRGQAAPITQAGREALLFRPRAGQEYEK